MQDNQSLAFPVGKNNLSVRKHTRFYHNGEKKTESIIQNSQFHGEQFSYYENGKLKSRIHYNQGKKFGEATFFYQNGKYKEFCNYKNNKLHGKRTEFYENGNLSVMEIYDNGKLIDTARYFFENGTGKAIIPYVKGKIFGKALYFYENGSLHKRVDYRNNKLHGHLRQYYITGEIEITRQYFYGKKTKTYKQFYPSGNIKITVPFDKQGNKTGELKMFYEDGSLQMRQGFKNDKRHGDSCKFYPNGNLKLKRFYINGQLDGRVVSFDETERTLSSVIYKLGKRNGCMKNYFYSPDGESVTVHEKIYHDDIVFLEIQSIDGVVQNCFRYGYNGRLNGMQNLQMSGKQKLQYYENGKLILETKDNINECCVCYEDTQFQTNCNHSLCFKCFLKTRRRECPMCRAKFF